jgi:hypothetical protein
VRNVQGKPIALQDLLIAAAESRILSQMGLDEDAERDFLRRYAYGDRRRRAVPTGTFLSEVNRRIT